METAINLVMILVSVVLILVVLLQTKGSSFSGAFGGDSGSIDRTRRGVEKNAVPVHNRGGGDFRAVGDRQHGHWGLDPGAGAHGGSPLSTEARVAVDFSSRYTSGSYPAVHADVRATAEG